MEMRMKEKILQPCSLQWQWEAGSDNFTLGDKASNLKAFAEAREVHLDFRSNPKDSHLSQSDLLLAELPLNMPPNVKFDGH